MSWGSRWRRIVCKSESPIALSEPAITLASLICSSRILKEAGLIGSCNTLKSFVQWFLLNATYPPKSLVFSVINVITPGLCYG